MKAATVRFEDDSHHALTVALAQNKDTLQALVDRSVAEYLDKQEAPTPEREEFLQVAKHFYKAARPDVREWLLATMRATIEAREKR